MFESTRRRALQALGIGGTAAVAGCSANAPSNADEDPTPSEQQQQATTKQTDVDQVARDPADMPGPIDRDEPKHHDITLEVEEVTAEIEPGVTFDYMTFGGTVPGPMLRVRQGDTVSFTLKNLPDNKMPHNVDMHAIYGTGGGSVATTAAPGESNSEKFKATYPGAYIYHCAVPNLDYHISSGMFGMIVVEPKEGLPEVDHEFYFGQHEVYTKQPTGAKGHHAFDMEAMKAEDPTYVLLNGEKYAYAAARYGPKEVSVGDSVRVFMVDGGPNVSSNFHPIGNVWAKGYRDGAFEGPTEKNVQTMKVPPGSCMVGTMECPVPERIKLVDHALSRVARKGLLAEIDVLGDKQTDIFDPEPNGQDEGPIYGSGGE
ncbi:MAG: copper-containing nitrite reductase [Halobacteriaceae archaeon]